MYDLIILGGGPAGYAAAFAAGRAGLKVAVFEGDRVGGTCLNVGCIPTKYLLDKGGFLKRLRAMTGSGVLRGAGEFSYSRIVRGKDAVVKKLTDGVAGLLKRHKIDLIGEFAEMAAPDLIRAGGREYRTKNILIATGSEPVTPPIPGAEHAVTSTELLALTRVPARLVVIGGGVIGIELASAMRAYGSEVTVVEMLPELFPGEEREIVRMLSRRLAKDGIKVVAGAKVTGIEARDGGTVVRWAKGDAPGEAAVDVVLMAVGRGARLTGIDAGRLGLAVEKGCIVVDERMRTNLPGVYAAGDVVDGWQLAHAAYAEAECAVDNILGRGRGVDLEAMPRCVYTMPPFAAVGMTSQAAKKAGMSVVPGRFPYAANGMALAEDAEEGAALVLSGEGTGRVVGVHIFGEGAHELIATATMAIANGMTVDRWERIITPHPSLSEILPEAALAGYGRARHIP